MNILQPRLQSSCANIKMEPVVMSVLLIVVNFITFYPSVAAYRPPHILDPDRPKILYITEGGRAVLPCRANGDPPPTYTWTKDGTEIIADERVTLDAVAGTLNVSNLRVYDEGVYRCVASNVFDDGRGGRIRPSSFSPEVTVYMSRIDRFTDNSPVTKKVTEFDYTELKCDKKGATVGASLIYMWYNARTSAHVSTDDGRLYIDIHGNLHFSYVLAKDAFTYTCGIGNSSFIRLGRDHRLEVTQTSNVGTIKPQLRYSNKEVLVKRFGTAKLECFFSGYSSPGHSHTATRWYDDAGKEITGDGTKHILSKHGRLLTVPAVLEEDEGRYYCQSNTTADKTELKSVFLNVTSPPVFINDSPNDQTAVESTDVVFQCDARSAYSELAPGPPVWYINGRKLESVTEHARLRLSNHKKTLTVMDVRKPRDILCVQCQVTNHVGTTWGNACLNVISPITVNKRPAMRQEIRHGDTVDLTVEASTDPSMLLNYRWEFRNTSYTMSRGPPFVLRDPVTHAASINTSALSPEEFRSVSGIYRIFIFHIYETKIVEAEVVLKVEGTELQLHSSTLFDLPQLPLQLALIILIIFTAVASAISVVFIVRVSCCKRRTTRMVVSAENVTQTSGSLRSHTYINTSAPIQNGATCTSAARMSERMYENCLDITELDVLLISEDGTSALYENTNYYTRRCSPCAFTNCRRL